MFSFPLFFGLIPSVSKYVVYESKDANFVATAVVKVQSYFTDWSLHTSAYSCFQVSFVTFFFLHQKNLSEVC